MNVLDDLELNQLTESRVEIVVPGFTLDRSIAMGAAWGVVAWSTYALVEYVLCCVVPLLTAERAVFTPLNWTLTAWLFNAYWVIGGVAGGICGVIAARLPGGVSITLRPNRSRLAGVFSLYLAVMMNFLIHPHLGDGNRPLLVIDSVLLCATAWVLVRPGSRIAPWLRIPPLLATFLLIGPSWLSNEMVESPGVLRRRFLMLLLVAGILTACRFLARYRDWTPARHLAINLALLALVIGSSAVLSGRNRALPALPARFAADPGLPPVVLVTLDTTRADHMSVYGYPRKTTPHLEEFARHATLYTNVVAASNWTLPSHASIFTGVYPSWHDARGYAGDTAVVRPLDDTVPTVAQILRDRGVFTIGVSANKFYLTPDWGLGRGFQSFNVQSPVEMLPLYHPYYLRNSIRQLLECCIETMGFDQQCRSAGEINADAINALEDGRVRNRSFFLFLNYMDAHWPYVAPVPAGVPLPSGKGAPFFSQFTEIMGDVLLRHAAFPERQRNLTIERYDAGIAAEDAALEDLMQWLKRRGLYDRALIIVTADHGEAFGEHQLMGHGLSSYQDLVHVPLLIKYPQQSTGQIVRGPVSHVDVLPTLLDTVGIPVPEKAQGISLRNAGDISNRKVLTESFPAQAMTRPTLVFNRTERAIRSGPYKLIVSDHGKHELFDVERDPLELHNLTAVGVPQAAGIETALQAWVRTVPAQTTRKAIDPEQLKRLKGLGYVR